MTTRGVDFEARYGLPLGFGAFGSDTSRLDLRFSGTRLIAFDYNPLAAILDLTIDCAGKFGQTCGNPYAKWRLSTRATYSTGPMTVSVLYRHLSAVKDDDSATTHAVERIKAYDYFDLTAAFRIKDGFTWSVGVNNVFDKQPPILGDNQQQANTYPSTYDLYGRAFFVSTNVKFGNEDWYDRETPPPSIVMAGLFRVCRPGGSSLKYSGQTALRYPVRRNEPGSQPCRCHHRAPPIAASGVICPGRGTAM
ncbi:TonB-dependent receptor [Sphingomonas aerolata]|uniref:TonB-dependent receptor domain-containing protein n=1 Tax=Sphingomonas aerolata TaxID=185951 RepID=UPI002FE3FC36